MILKTIVFPQSGGENQGGKFKRGNAKIKKKPIKYTHLNLEFVFSIFVSKFFQPTIICYKIIMTLSIRHNKNYPFVELSEEKFTDSRFNN